MKSIFLIIMLAITLFSSEKQIIVGSFLHEKNALNSLVKLNNNILNDDKLSTLINKNSIEVELKKIGEYHAISLSPFTSYVQLLRTLRALESYYNDAYVLDNATNKKIAKEVIEEKVAALEVKTQKIEKEIEIEKVKERPKSDDSVEVKIHKKIAPINTQIEEQADYTLEILLAFLLLVGAGYIFYKRSKSKKEETQA
ncbi:hypothetical protein SMGD1_1074 [Sulfurimonas gotlandica GD1]|uniref:Uncharacterized protein n=1 Tax=Sulfurimonas gotlandica (strain DSM 19862 / JCM 16533 / GD1) TaxID=929558 RepID=B6BGH0_SULGG|nr:hypothetical protein [Sulfurimonas gotlandica]EDZ63596.1 hypothetical protein CBGD1_1216 [Sulfurimonas gotlandica GD1]EHP29598.1 hypothetical protein SMGD1_1074 [Sulfurimonas gotlandica GD1]